MFSGITSVTVGKAAKLEDVVCASIIRLLADVNGRNFFILSIIVWFTAEVIKTAFIMSGMG